MPGTLYIVATPIGNLADITLRALQTLKEVDLIAAEDTRVTRNLLSHYGIDTPTTPYHQHSLGKKATRLIDKLKAGQNIALVSDAGTPGISDPGCDIIQLAIADEVPIVVIPGASAFITALVESGLPTRRFVFEGFLPRRGSDRRAHLRTLLEEQRTMVFYESPHRVVACLKDMLSVWGDRPVAFVREATKMFEEVHRGTVTSAIECFASRQPRGEFTIVAAGNDACEDNSSSQEESIERALELCLSSGVSERDAVREVTAKFAVPRKEIYRLMLALKRSHEKK
jgi:16S rRNA (cytidine1402-2'-O)-methyltransferase